MIKRLDPPLQEGFFYAIPENPINARAKRPAVTKAIGIPFIPLGISASSICSLNPAKVAKANPKPMALAPANTTDSINPKSLLPTARMATPKTAQFVVINGR